MRGRGGESEGQWPGGSRQEGSSGYTGQNESGRQADPGGDSAPGYAPGSYGNQVGYAGRGRETGGGEMNDRGYEREFYGVNEGRGSGAGSRRYSEIDQGYMGGEYAGGEYGGPRSQRSFGGGPRLDPEFTSSDAGDFPGGQYGGGYGATYGDPGSDRWQRRYGGSQFDRGEFESGGGRGGSESWRRRSGQPGGYAGPGYSGSRGGQFQGGMQGGMDRETERVHWGVHAPWELRPHDSRSEGGRFGGGQGVRPGWQEGGSGSYAQGGRGSQYGRGPKGYSRSDDRLSEEINEQLMRDPDIDASEVEVKVERGVVTLGGSVEDRRVKHEIENLVAGVMGVKDVANQLRIQQNRSNGHSASDGDRGETSASSGRQSGSSASSTSSKNR